MKLKWLCARRMGWSTIDQFPTHPKRSVGKEGLSEKIGCKVVLNNMQVLQAFP